MPTNSNMRKLSLFVLMPVLAFIARAQADLSFHFQSQLKRTALLELYTSEGCSSCPPAEAWLSRLQDSPRLWKDFAPIAFHVDYWNYLGWNDRWSDGAFSERQRAYAQLWQSENIYTPEFVLDGREWHNWFTGKNGPKPVSEQAGLLIVTSPDRNHWLATFVPESPLNASYEIHAALLAGGIVSDIKAGENAGRRLNHDFVVVNLVQIGMTTTSSIARGKFFLEFPRYNPGKTLALTVWVTHAGQLEPLQSTGGWLVAPLKN
jgi:hypothetical protein